LGELVVNMVAELWRRYPSLRSPTGGGESEIHSLLYLFCTTVANGIMWLYSHHTTAPLTFLQYISALNFTIELTYFGIVSMVSTRGQDNLGATHRT